jgi:hypothetical protein
VSIRPEHNSREAEATLPTKGLVLWAAHHVLDVRIGKSETPLLRGHHGPARYQEIAEIADLVVWLGVLGMRHGTLQYRIHEFLAEAVAFHGSPPVFCPQPSGPKWRSNRPKKIILRALPDFLLQVQL